MPSSTLRIPAAEMVCRSDRRAANIAAIGASSRGAGLAGAPERGARKPSSQSTSARSRVTCRMFHATPRSRTATITPFRTGLAAKACASGSPSSPATSSTAARKASMRHRKRRGCVIPPLITTKA